jgi:hypothetical protein
MAWKFLYSNGLTEADGVGRVVAPLGSKQALFDAIRNGADIRVGYDYNNAGESTVWCPRWRTESVRINADETEALAVILVHGSNLIYNPKIRFDPEHGPYEGVVMDAWFLPGIAVLGTDGYERFWRQGKGVYVNNRPQNGPEQGRRVIQWFGNV